MARRERATPHMPHARHPVKSRQVLEVAVELAPRGVSSKPGPCRHFFAGAKYFMSGAGCPFLAGMR
jgi:hypothetical protein